MESKLYVGNLPNETVEEDLRSLFAGAGTVVSVLLIREHDTGKSKGFAFVEMGSQAEADHALRMFNGFSLGQKNLKVERARVQVEHSPQGDGNGGHSKEGGSQNLNRRGRE